MELTCINVLGGWQTGIRGTGVVFGPVYNNIADLWRWQRDNIFTPIKEGRRPSCLLYTSPSPRDGATSRMPSSA